jgi:hypothetical protein
MTTKQPFQPGQDPAAHDLFADRPDVMEVMEAPAASHAPDRHDAAFGSRLRAALIWKPARMR